MNESQHETRYLRMDEIMRIGGFKTKQTVYNWIKDGIWPRQIKWGARAVRWPSNEVYSVCRARNAGKSTEEIRALVQQLHAARTTGAESTATQGEAVMAA